MIEIGRIIAGIGLGLVVYFLCFMVVYSVFVRVSAGSLDLPKADDGFDKEAARQAWAFVNPYFVIFGVGWLGNSLISILF